MRIFLKYNRHLKEGFSYGYETKRDLFNELARYPDARQTVGTIGLRKTGKTVLLEQLIDFLVKGWQRRDKILYFSFDDETVTIDDVVVEF